MGLPPSKLTLRFLTEKRNLSFQLRILCFTFAGIFCSTPGIGKGCFLLCLVFFWGVLYVNHRLARSCYWDRSWGGATELLAAVPRKNRSLAGRRVGLSSQSCAVSACIRSHVDSGFQPVSSHGAHRLVPKTLWHTKKCYFAYLTTIGILLINLQKKIVISYPFCSKVTF